MCCDNSLRGNLEYLELRIEKESDDVTNANWNDELEVPGLVCVWKGFPYDYNNAWYLVSVNNEQSIMKMVHVRGSFIM